MDQRRCPACGEADGSALFRLQSTWHGPALSRTEYSLIDCHRCETLFQSPEPPIGDLNIIYNEIQFTSSEYTDMPKVAGAVDYYGSCLTRMAERRGWAGPLSVLEVGAGRAMFCLVAKLAFPGSRTIAQDVTPECSKTTPWVDDYQCSTLSNLKFSEHFHVVSLTHVIEHLVNPLGELGLISRNLRNDGIVYLTAPYRPKDFSTESADAEIWRKWSYNHVPGHVQYFSKRGIEALAMRAGLKLEQWEEHHDMGQAFEAWLRVPD